MVFFSLFLHVVSAMSAMNMVAVMVLLASRADGFAFAPAPCARPLPLTAAHPSVCGVSVALNLCQHAHICAYSRNIYVHSHAFVHVQICVRRRSEVSVHTCAPNVRLFGVGAWVFLPSSDNAIHTHSPAAGQLPPATQ
jgi:hypothetical protein